MSSSGRGAGWVWLQFALMAILIGAGFLPPDWPHGVQPILSAVALVLLVTGGLLAVWASRLLGAGFTPYPRPLAAGELVVRGPYRVVRHPVYTAGLVFFTGYSSYTGLLALVMTAVLGIVWALKARVEEGFLRERYPEYEAYQRRVRYRLLPFLY